MSDLTVVFVALSALGLLVAVLAALLSRARGRTPGKAWYSPDVLILVTALVAVSAGFVAAVVGFSTHAEYGIALAVRIEGLWNSHMPGHSEALWGFDPDNSRLRAPFLYLAMVVGMVAKTTWDAIEVRRSHGRIRLDPWAAVRPLLVSPIVFQAILSTKEAVVLDAVTLTFAFQNGFTWQTLLGRVLSAAPRK